MPQVPSANDKQDTPRVRRLHIVSLLDVRSEEDVRTDLSSVSVWALGLCAVTGLGCIPFCIGRLKNVEHGCENCEQKLATWHRHDGRVDLHI